MAEQDRGDDRQSENTSANPEQKAQDRGRPPPFKEGSPLGEPSRGGTGQSSTSAGTAGDVGGQGTLAGSRPRDRSPEGPAGESSAEEHVADKDRQPPASRTAGGDRSSLKQDRSSERRGGSEGGGGGGGD